MINNTVIITIHILLWSSRLDGIIIEETFWPLSRVVWLVSSQGSRWTLTRHMGVHAVFTKRRLPSCHSAIKLKYSAVMADLLEPFLISSFWAHPEWPLGFWTCILARNLTCLVLSDKLWEERWLFSASFCPSFFWPLEAVLFTPQIGLHSNMYWQLWKHRQTGVSVSKWFPVNWMYHMLAPYAVVISETKERNGRWNVSKNSETN